MRIYFSLGLGVAFFIGLFILFPAKWVGMFLLLSLLCTALFAVVWRNLFVLPKEAQEKEAALLKNFSFQEKKVPFPLKEKEEEKENLLPTKAEGSSPLNPDLFTTFQSHMEKAEESPPPSISQPLAERVEDKIDIHPPKQPNPPKEKAQRRVEEENIPDLAKDEIFAGASSKKVELEPQEKAPQEEKKTKDLQEEIALLLKLSKKAMQTGDVLGATVGLRQAKELAIKSPTSHVSPLDLMEGQLALQKKDKKEALRHLEKALEKGLLEEEPEKLVAEVQSMKQKGELWTEFYAEALQKILDGYRQKGNRQAMDVLYGHLEKAQEKTGDDAQILQIYRNHLEIKKSLNDVPGQLALIDKIGNRYYRMGDTKAAREFYAQGVKTREKNP